MGHTYYIMTKEQTSIHFENPLALTEPSGGKCRKQIKYTTQTYEMTSSAWIKHLLHFFFHVSNWTLHVNHERWFTNQSVVLSCFVESKINLYAVLMVEFLLNWNFVFWPHLSWSIVSMILSLNRASEAMNLSLFIYLFVFCRSSRITSRQKHSSANQRELRTTEKAS